MKRILMIAMLVGCGSFTVHAQIVINEVCPANADINYDLNHYNYSPWIELYNAGANTVSVGGYYLSDDPAVKNKWRIPSSTSIASHGYLLIWCDDMKNGMHTNFSLDSDGEDVVLSNTSAQVVDQVTFPEQFTNVSYGRLTNGGSTWGYMVHATPGAGNNAQSGTTQLSKPIFSVTAGKYSGAQSVQITHAMPGVEIRYTTNGSEPNTGSAVYASPISIKVTGALKAKAYKAGSLPSKTETATYFINEHKFTLPVVSLTTRSEYLWDNTIGIYTDGTNGIPGNCRVENLNWNQDWDRHAVFEYFDANGERVFDQDVDIRIGGACSRGQAQKAFVVKARDKYGKKTLDYKFFPNKDIDAFGGFNLRNSGNDFNVTMFRDAVLQHLVVGQMDIDYLDYQPAILYLNGQYWGIQNLNEKIDADYIEANYGIDKDDLDLLETWETPLEGSNADYQSYKSTLQSMDRSTDEAYDFISQHIDVQEYINYLITEIYVCNTDWPGNNVKFWRQRSVNGKYRWILWDMDFGFALYDGSSYATHPTLTFATDPDNTDWPNPAFTTLHIRMVLENPKFRKQFIETLNAAMNTTFAPERVNRIIEEFRARIVAEMPYHKARWTGQMSDFEWQVKRMKDFAVARNTYMRLHAADFFGLTQTVTMSLSAPSGGGTFKLNGIASDESTTEESYFKGFDYRVEPAPAPGYKFKEWKITRRDSELVPMIKRGDSWKYYDLAVSPGATWASNAFNDGSWTTGIAQLGYGDDDEMTVVSFGGDLNNKNITSYYRKSFSIADTVGLEAITSEALYDDGIVVYLNGTEVYRANMPQGTITHTTFATEAILLENNWVGFTIPKGIIRPGTNVLAVEIHQNASNSSDISFDFSMRTVRQGDQQTTETSTVALQQGAAFSDLTFEATYEPDDRVISGLVINELSTKPSALLDNAGDAEDWIEIYNGGTKTVDLTGLYLTDNAAQKKKHRILSGGSNEMVLAPGGYKLFWADDEVNEGASHVNFKLSNEGEMVGLYQELDGVLNTLDVVTFGEQFGKGSFSRIPNATGPFVFTAEATPTMSNAFVTGIEGEEVPGVYPNPVGSTLFIKSNYRVERADIVDCYGKMVRTFSDLRLESSLPVSDIKPGLYLLRLKSSYGWKTVKIVKD